MIDSARKSCNGESCRIDVEISKVLTADEADAHENNFHDGVTSLARTSFVATVAGSMTRHPVPLVIGATAGGAATLAERNHVHIWPGDVVIRATAYQRHLTHDHLVSDEVRIVRSNN